MSRGSARGSLSAEAKIALAGLILTVLAIPPAYIAIFDRGGSPDIEVSPLPESLPSSPVDPQPDSVMVSPTDESVSPTESTSSTVDLLPPATRESAMPIAEEGPTPTYLADMDVVYGRYLQFVTKDDLTFVGFRNSVLESGGVTYAHSVYHRDLGARSPAYIEYNLRKNYSKLSFVAALDDAAPDTAKVRYEIYLDGVKVRQLDVRFGQPRKVTIDTAGHLRLRLYMLRLDDGPTFYNVGFGDALLTP